MQIKHRRSYVKLQNITLLFMCCTDRRVLFGHWITKSLNLSTILTR